MQTAGSSSDPLQPLSARAGHRPLILLVDDYEDALAIYGQYLDYSGYRVVVARNGEEAVLVAKIHRPELILLDLRMPIMSGTEALQVLRADPAFDRIPIIALTAHALENERVQALAAGFDQVVSKPCMPDELVTIIEAALPARQAS